MSPQPDDLVPDNDDEVRIADYLTAHPDFLHRHPEVLARIDVPHASGGAVSLIERQVNLLRSRADRYQRQLEDLIEVARENDRLGRRLHHLTLALIEARDFDEVLNALQDQLRDQFRADAVELKLFSSRELEEHAAEPGPTLFREFMTKARPSCGCLEGERLEYLFGEQAGETGSVALIPVTGDQCRGVLAIGSRDPGRFHPGKSVDFLQRLGELVSQTLQGASGPGA